jgi:hypothetical protein
MSNRGFNRLASLFFLGCALILAGFTYQLVSSGLTAHAGPGPAAATPQSQNPVTPVEAPGTLVSIQINQAALIEGSRIVYRGLSDGRVHFDHYLIDFNPHYAFKYAVAVDEAENGFAIGKHRLRVTHAGGSWVHFKLAPKPYHQG